MIAIQQKLCPIEKYKIKCPYHMNAEAITIHNTANDASANAEISYMISNNQETSFHFAVDDKEAIQGIPLDRNAWHAGDGNGKGNRKTIAIEICYSKSGGERFERAMNNAAQLTAQLLKERGWGLDRVTKHQDYSGKYCPHRILSDYGWNYFLNLVANYLNGSNIENTTKTATVDVTYQTHDDVKNQWLPNVVNQNDYAGNFKNAVDGLYANLSSGNITYKVHTVKAGWLPEVTNRNDYAGNFNQPIDALAIKTDTGHNLHYRVHIKGKNWLPAVSGYNVNDSVNGYAGNLGQVIDAVQIWLDPKTELPESSTNNIPDSIVSNASETEIYRVRSSWEDARSQSGAYSYLANAIKCATDNQKNIYDNKGNCVWEYKSYEREKYDIGAQSPTDGKIGNTEDAISDTMDVVSDNNRNATKNKYADTDVVSIKKSFLKTILEWIWDLLKKITEK